MSPSTSSVSVCACSRVSCYVGAHIYIYIYLYIYITQDGGQILCTQHGSGRAGMEARQGNAPFLVLEKARRLSRDAWEPRIGLTCPSPPPWFCLEVWLNPGGIFFPSACSLSTGFSSFSPRCFMFACHTSGPPGQPTAFIHTPSKSFPPKRSPDDATSHSGSKTPSTAAASPQAIWKQLDCLSNN